MKIPVRLIAGLAAGAAAMYLFDPVSGRRRRALARDQGAAACRRTTRQVSGQSRRVADRVRGSLAQARSKIAAAAPADDRTLDARVRAELGHVASQPSAIATQVSDGRVVLQGDAPADELQDIVGRLAAIPGIVEVDNRLSTRSATAAATPSL